MGVSGNSGKDTSQSRLQHGRKDLCSLSDRRIRDALRARALTRRIFVGQHQFSVRALFRTDAPQDRQRLELSRRRRGVRADHFRARGRFFKAGREMHHSRLLKGKCVLLVRRTCKGVSQARTPHSRGLPDGGASCFRNEDDAERSFRI